jgi:hypothetical protein
MLWQCSPMPIEEQSACHLVDIEKYGFFERG